MNAAEGLALLLLFWRMMQSKQSIAWGTGWVWPVPDLETFVGPESGGTATNPARISQEYKPIRHLGVDIMYRDGGRWVAPEGTPVVAARAGRVWSVTRGPRGIAVVLDHGVPWATFYQHLESATVKAGDQVTAGQRLGVMGADPTDPQGLRHLHFATWYRGSGDAASVDPGPVMASWARTTWA